MCLGLMLALEPGGSLLDLGCGSGVLAIAAARLGWAPVLALDNDPASVEATAANARVNGVEVEVRRHDLRTEPVESASTVAANLVAPLLRAWAGRLPDAAGAPERVIAGGLLVGEAEQVATAFSARGLAAVIRRHLGEWAALLLARE
jgi:ribosomal protein L11 methyltransferase